MSSWGFKDNLTIDNSKYLKWLDSTGIIQNNIIGLDLNSHVKLNSAANGDIYINTSADNGSVTYINTSNENPVFIGSKLGVGISTGNQSVNFAATIALKNNGYIGLLDDSSDIGIVGGSSLTSGSKILLSGNDKAGQLDLYAGDVSTGNINMYSGENSLKMQILNNGTTNFSPDGTTIRVSIEDPYTTITNQLRFTSTEESYSSTTGSVLISGGVGIKGNTYIDGILSINSASGNIDFNNTKVSTNYSTGTIFISGGLGIDCSAPAESPNNGGGISCAGGLGLGQNAMIAGNVTVYSTETSNSSQTGSIIAYGGVGINGQTNIRSSSSPQIRIAPVTSGGETSIYFSSQNDYTKTGSWTIGKGGGSGDFAFVRENDDMFMYFDDNINLNKYISVTSTLNFSNDLSENLITFKNADGNINWSLGKILSDNKFHISRFDSNGSLLNKGITIENDTGVVMIYSTDNSTNLTTGGVVILGGTAIHKDLYVGGDIKLGTSTTSGIILLGTAGTISETYSTLNQLTLTSTETSCHNSQGSLVTFGGINILNTGNASSVSCGNALTVAGGVAIRKDLYVGGTSNLQDLSTTNFSSENIIATNITSSTIYANEIGVTTISAVNLISLFSSVGSVYAAGSTIDNFVATNISTTSLNVLDIMSSTGSFSSISTSSLEGIRLLFDTGTITNLVTENITTATLNTTIGITTVTLLATGQLDANYNSNTLGSLFTTGGNVGFGTTMPKTPIHVVTGITDVLVTLEQTSYTNGNYIYFTNLDKTGYIGLTTEDTFIITPPTGENLLLTNNASTIFVGTAGNIGINTTDPNYSLDINGTIHGNNDLYLEGKIIVGQDLSNYNSYIIDFNYNTDGNISNSIGFGFSGNTDLMTLDGNGNLVGITAVFTDGITTSSLLITSNIPSENSTTGSIITLGGISIDCDINSSSITSGGALSVAGGIALSKDIYIGGNFIAPNAIGTINNLLISSVDNSLGVGSGGNLTVLGGASVSNDLYVGTKIGVGNSTINPQQILEVSPILYSKNQDGGIRISTKNAFSTLDNSYRYIDYRLKSNNSNNYRGVIVGSLSGGVPSEQEFMAFSQDTYTYIYSPTRFTNNTESYNSTVASSIFTGGVSIACIVDATTISNGGALTIAGGASIAKTLIVNNLVYANPATANNTFANLVLVSESPSLDVSVGSLIVAGGISIQTLYNATSVTSGGGLTVAGGIASESDIYIGGTGYLSNVSSANVNFGSTNTEYLSNPYWNTIGNLYTNSTDFIGISTTDPTVLLDFGTWPDNNKIGLLNFDSGEFYGIGANTSGMLYQTHNAHIFYVGSTTGQSEAALGAPCVIVSSSGNVGINNINPSYKLDVDGVIHAGLDIDSVNSTTGALFASGGVSISRLTNASSVTEGGALTVAGGVAIAQDLIVGGTITSSSDCRLKKNIREINTDILNKIDNLRTVKYNAIDDQLENPIDLYGFIAQDFEENFPELLKRQSPQSYYSFDYARVTVLLMKCIKELKTEITLLKKGL
jgi:hypothetical protein